MALCVVERSLASLSRRSSQATGLFTIHLLLCQRCDLRNRTVLQWFKDHRRDTQLRHSIKILQKPFSAAAQDRTPHEDVIRRMMQREEDLVQATIPAVHILTPGKRERYQPIIDAVLSQNFSKAKSMLGQLAKAAPADNRTREQVHVALFIDQNKPRLVKNRVRRYDTTILMMLLTCILLFYRVTEFDSRAPKT